MADLAAGESRARRAAAPSLRLDEEETALFLLADRNGDAVLEMAEWGLTGEIRLQQQAEMQEYAALLRAQRLGAELNYPDSWQMLLALRDAVAARVPGVDVELGWVDIHDTRLDATLAALGFLGFGIQPTVAAEWGFDLNKSISDVAAGIWWTAIPPGIAIVLTILGITLIGESLNDLADPRLRIRRAPRRKGATTTTETEGVE